MRIGRLFALSIGTASIACLLVDPFDDLAKPPPSAPPEASLPDASVVLETLTDAEAETSNTVDASCQPSVELCETPFDENCDGEGACTGAHTWVRQFGDGLTQSANALALDKDGNVYVAGRFFGTLPGVLPDGGDFVQAGSDSAPDAFLLELSPTGELLWARAFPDAVLSTIAAAPNGGIVVGGGLGGPTEIPGCGAFTLPGMLIARFDGVGNCTKAFHFGDGKSKSVSGLAADSNDDVVVVGSFDGTLTFGPDAGLTAEKTSPYYARLDPDLVAKHAWSIAVDGRYTLRGVAINSQHDAFMFGNFFGWFGLSYYDGRGNLTGFVKKVNLAGESSGPVLDFGEGGTITPFAGVVDAADRLVLAGLLERGRIPVADGWLEATDGGAGNLFLLRPMRPSEGKTYGGLGYEEARAIAVDPAGNIVVAGKVGGTPSTVGGESVDASPSGQAFIAKYDASFRHLWSHFFGGDTKPKAAMAVATDRHGNIVAAGTFSGATDFGDPAKHYDAAGPSSANSDVFVLRRAP